MIKTISLQRGQLIKQRLRGGVLETRHEITVWDGWGAESLLTIELRTHYRYVDLPAEAVTAPVLSFSHQIRAPGEDWRPLRTKYSEDEQVRAIVRMVNWRLFRRVLEARAAQNTAKLPYGFVE